MTKVKKKKKKWNKKLRWKKRRKIVKKPRCKKTNILVSWTFAYYMVYAGEFPGNKVLSPNINIFQDQPSSNVQKQPSRVAVKKERAIL